VRRGADLVEALAGRTGDVRLGQFRRVLTSTAAHQELSLDDVLAEYGRVMRFLYRKEFVSRDLNDPQQLETYLASLYQERGHSTDTAVEANFAVHTALSVVRARGERRLERVLVVGPGLDFAPRTDLVDLFEPQSYQPFAVADALLSLQLSDRRRLRVHCVDINARVVEYLQGLAHDRPTPLRLLSGVPERGDRAFTSEYRRYFAGLGTSIGRQGSMALPPALGRHLALTVHVDPDVAARITAERLDIVTQRYEPSPLYDLVVVTNVFSYFDPVEQLLALSNIASMLRDGGYLVHNEPQTGLLSAAARLGLEMTDARTVLIAAHATAPLFDRVVVHRMAERHHPTGIATSDAIPERSPREAERFHCGGREDSLRAPALDDAQARSGARRIPE
jgi:hypothetical protein